MHFCFVFHLSPPSLLKWSQLDKFHQTKHNNRKLYTRNYFSPHLLLLFLSFPHEILLTLRCNIHWPCIFVQSYITETPWVFFGRFRNHNASLDHRRLYNRAHKLSLSGKSHPARCFPYNFTFTHAFASRTIQSKHNICPSLAADKQSPHSC